MRVYLIYRTQLEVTFTFLLFQTTKGASAFKICRGVEAVGGSLRSVTTSVRSLESVLGMALSLFQECMKSVSSLEFTETVHIVVSEAAPSRFSHEVSTVFKKEQPLDAHVSLV